MSSTISEDALLSFETGGVAKRSDTEPFLEAFVSDYLSRREKRLAVFETPSQVGDLALATSREPYFTHGDEVYYYYLNAGNLTPESARGAIVWAREYPFVGLLTQLPAARSIRDQGRVDDEFLYQIADGLDHLLIGAYDEEAVLIWSKDRG